MNPFPNMPNTTDLGDGVRMVGSHDKGHCFRIIEPDESVFVTILASSPLAPRPASENGSDQTT